MGALVKADSLFKSPKLSCSYTLPDSATLDKSISSGALSEIGGSVDGQTRMNVFQREIGVGAKLSAKVKFYPQNTGVSAFEDRETGAPPNDLAYSALLIDGSFSTSGSADIPAGSFIISPSIKADASVKYAHLLPGVISLTYKEAVLQVVRSSCLPCHLEFSKIMEELACGELHELQMKLALDLGVKFSWGKKLQLQLDSLDANKPFKVQLEAVLKAYLGLSLMEDMRITVVRDAGNPNDWVLKDNWIRVRLNRVKERRLTLGVQFNLLVKYDLASPLQSLLEDVFDWQPIQSLMKAFTDISPYTKAIANGDLNSLKALLSKELADFFFDFVGDDLFTYLADTEQAKEFIDMINWIVDHFNTLDESMQSLWEKFLSKAHLDESSQLRHYLELIASLEKKSLKAVLEVILDETSVNSDAWKQAIELLEVMTGYALEQMITGEELVLDSIHQAAAFAKKALEFIDPEKIPAQFWKLFETYCEKTKVDSIISWLAQHATSLDKLKKEAEAQTKRFIEKVLGISFDSINQEQLDKIKNLADAANKLINDATTFEKELKKDLEKLKGEHGISLAMEFSRLSRKTAIIDIELNPETKQCQTIFNALTRGEIATVVDELIALDEKDDSNPLDLFMLRECVFTSHLVRNSIDLANFLSVTKHITRRITNAATTYAKTTEEKRDTDFSSGLLRIIDNAKRHTIMKSGVWLDIHATDTDLKDPYAAFTAGLRLTFFRRDNSIGQSARAGLVTLCNDLGFLADGSELDIPDKAKTQVGIYISFNEGIELLTTLLSNIETNWLDYYQDFINAAYRWLDEPLVPELISKPHNMRWGYFLAKTLLYKEAPSYLEIWKTPGMDENKFLETYISGFSTIRNITIDGVTKSLKKVDSHLHPAQFTVLSSLVRNRNISNSLISTISNEFKGIAKLRNHESFIKLTNSFTNAFKPMVNLTHDSPLLPLWFIISRLTRLKPTLLQNATGVAIVRIKKGNSWELKHQFSLKNGLREHEVGRSTGIFPVRLS